MADAQPTIGDLYRRGEVTDADLVSIIAGWLEDRVEGPIPIGRHQVDVAAAVAAHSGAVAALADPDAEEAHKLDMIKVAIVMGQVERA